MLVPAAAEQRGVARGVWSGRLLLSSGEEDEAPTDGGGRES